MLAFIILCLVFGVALAALFVSALLAVGWRAKYLTTVKAANQNAGYWAQAESEKQDAIYEMAQLRGALKISEVNAERFHGLAKDAINVAGEKHNLGRVLADDDSPDSILDAGEIE